MDEPLLPPEIEGLKIDPSRPVVVVDVDEVLGMFMQGFEQFVGLHGLEMRIDRFALFQNIYRPGQMAKEGFRYVSVGRADAGA